MYWTWFLFVSLWMVLPGSIDLLAADWPMFQHDASRSGITADAPQLSKRERWIYQPLVGPDPAWPAPAARDYWHQIRELNPLMTFDRAFQVVASEGVVVFGSSSENKVIAVDQLTGMTKWSAFTEGPVRFAPTIWEGTVYVGCDGGWVHAWDLQTGDLRWTKNANLRDQRLPGNGKMISLFPIRTGILIEEGVAYYMAGLFPLQGVEMHAVDAKTGEERWRQVCDSVSPQGYMLSASNRLIVPTGRTSPAIFARDGGKLLQKIDDLGGSFAIVVDDLLIHQQGRQTNQLGVREPSDQKIATFDGIRMIVHEGYAFLQNKTQIACLDRTRYLQVSREKNQLSQQFEELKKQCATAAADVADTIQQQLQAVQQEIGRCTRELNECLVWKAETAFPYAMIKAGDNLLVGGDDMVAMLDGKTGKELWTGAVRGRAYGLAVADGDLFVSTDSGFIYCFGRGERTGLISPVVNRAPYPEAADNPVYAACAEKILKETQITKGYCLIVGLEDGQLAYELAKRSELTIVALDEDPGKVATIRQTLENTGLYGPRITVAAAAMERLPLNSYLANLIVSESGLKTGSLPCASSELFRILRPYGGILYSGQAKEWRTQTPSADWKEWLTPLVLEEGKTVAQADGWLMLKRGRVEGNGEWTHLYAEPGNSACSQDMVDGPMTIQWFGRPGPSDIVDRHHRPMSSLFKDGRVFIPANDKVFALDAYNGTPLWSQDIPYSRRIGAMKNSCQMVLTADLLYVAEKENCHAYAVDSGELVSTFQAPQLLLDRRQDWGYLATVGDHLYGSTNHAGAAFYELSEDTCDLLEGDFRDLIL
ncbi:MAG: PQQ-binding-like beta-propeller repeat protein, partial [bacterium]|nr:PQQ-binding-like beta-propeller repeat protein [bacterium]